MLCQPVPIATPELIDVEEKSERICSMPVVDTNTLTIGPFAALRRRNRSTLLPEARFTFTLRQAVEVGLVRSR